LNYLEIDYDISFELQNFDAIDFIASICSHIPNKNEQMLCYLGYYSNVCPGRRKKQGSAESDYVIEDEEYLLHFP
jgi:hypothetical protein